MLADEAEVGAAQGVVPYPLGFSERDGEQLSRSSGVSSSRRGMDFPAYRWAGRMGNN
jgi:hypothetical protein